MLSTNGNAAIKVYLCLFIEIIIKMAKPSILTYVNFENFMNHFIKKAHAYVAII